MARDPDIVDERGQRDILDHPDPYNYTRRYGLLGLPRKRSREDESVGIFYSRTPEHKRVKVSESIKGAEDGGTVSNSDVETERRRRRLQEDWFKWKRAQNTDKQRSLGQKSAPPSKDDRSWLRKVWDNPYGKTAIITAGVGLAGLGMDAAMSRSAGLSTAVEKFGRNLRDNRFTQGLSTQKYPAGAGGVNFMTRPTRTGVSMAGTYLEGSAQRHLANMYRPPPPAFSGQRITSLN